MHRVDTTTAVAELPENKPAGTPGYFTQGDFNEGIPATTPGQDWFNAVQEELIGLIEGAGLTPSKADYDQILQAVRCLVHSEEAEIDVLSTYGGGISYSATSINAAITAVGGNATTLYLKPGNWVMDANISAPSNVRIKFPKGAVLNTTGHTFTAYSIDAGHYQIFTGTGTVAIADSQPEVIEWFGISGGSDYPKVQNGNVVRWPHNFTNFLANGGCDAWLGGTNVPPSCWQIVGATCARSSTSASGPYSAQVTFSAAGQSFWNSIGNFGRYGRYTFSGYYQKISGAGGAAAVIQLGQSPYTEHFIMDLNNTIDGEWRLFTVSGVIPEGSWGLSSKFGFNSRDGASVWLFDECMVQEGLNFASSWTPAPIWDSGSGQYVFQRLFMAGINLISPNPPAAANSTGAYGQIEWDADNIYICTATNTWISIPKSQVFKGNLGAYCLGYNQSWAAVSRSSGTSYTNSGAKPIAISIYSVGGNFNNIQLYVDGNHIMGSESGSGGGYAQGFAIVPPGSSWYYVSNVSCSVYQLG
jgi:hypothetical protein